MLLPPVDSKGCKTIRRNVLHLNRDGLIEKQIHRNIRGKKKKQGTFKGTQGTFKLASPVVCYGMSCKSAVCFD